MYVSPRENRNSRRQILQWFISKKAGRGKCKTDVLVSSRCRTVCATGRISHQRRAIFERPYVGIGDARLVPRAEATVHLQSAAVVEWFCFHWNPRTPWAWSAMKTRPVWVVAATTLFTLSLQLAWRVAPASVIAGRTVRTSPNRSLRAVATADVSQTY